MRNVLDDAYCIHLDNVTSKPVYSIVRVDSNSKICGVYNGRKGSKDKAEYNAKIICDALNFHHKAMLCHIDQQIEAKVESVRAMNTTKHPE